MAIHWANLGDIYLGRWDILSQSLEDEQEMSSTETTERVKAIIVEQLGVPSEEVIESASFIEDLGADSLDIVELVMALEEEYDIEISDEDAEKIQTVGDAISYIQEHSA